METIRQSCLGNHCHLQARCPLWISIFQPNYHTHLSPRLLSSIIISCYVCSELGTAPKKIPYLLTVSLSRCSVDLVARFGLHTQKSILVCLFLHPHCYVLLQAKSALETRLRFVYLVPSGYIWLCKPSNLRVLCKTVLLFNMDIHIPSKC